MYVGTFDSVGGLTLLHYVPTVELQSAILAGGCACCAVGALVASDSLPSDALGAAVVALFAKKGDRRDSSL